MKKRILAVIPVRNRSKETNEFLFSLKKIEIPEGIRLSVTVIDDGSTDDTVARLKNNHPEIELFEADGSLFWSGAAIEGIKEALRRDYSHVFLLNDDMIVDPNILKALVDAEEKIPGRIYTGTVFDKEGQIIYGGIIQERFFRFRKVDASDFYDEKIEVDTVNGNCLLIPLNALSDITLPNKGVYVQEGFDIFIGLSFKKKSKRPVAVQNAIAHGSPNVNKLWFYSNSYSLSERLKGVLGPKGVRPRMYWDLCYRFSGILFPILFVRPYIKALIGVSGKKKP